MNDPQARLEAIRAKREAGKTITPEEVIEAQTIKLRELKAALREEVARAERAEAALRETQGRLEAEATLRPSLEVLQRMANGLDPFDRGRFQCAVEALAYERPKLTANISAGMQLSGIGTRLDALTKAQSRGLRLVGPLGPDDAA